MKYLFYQLYREDVRGDRLRATEEMITADAIVWDDDLNTAIVFSGNAPDLFIPMSYDEYLKFLNAFKTSGSVELKGYCGFNELLNGDFGLERTDKDLEDANKEYLERVRMYNNMSEFGISVAK